MNRTTLGQLVNDHYSGKSLPAATAARLAAMVSSGASATSATDRMPRRRGRSMLAAAAIAALAFAGGYTVSRVTGPAALPAAAILAAGDPAPGLDEHALPDLVAVNIKADWCLRTPEVGPIFAGFTEQYGDRPILFVTIDITDEGTRRQSRYLASSLGISHVYDEPFASGVIKLVDRRQGVTLATLTGVDEAPMLDGLLAQALEPRR